MFACLLAGLVVAAAPWEEPLGSMDGWQQVGGNERSFQLQDGVLEFVELAGDEPASLLTSEDYENFELEFEFRFDGWVESGVYLHAPRNGAYRAGIEVELESHLGGTTPYSMGALFRVAPPLKGCTKREGWNTCRIVMDWPQLDVTINDEVLQSTDLSQHPDLRYTLRRGAIGFQHQGWKQAVRNVRVKRLPDAEHGLVLCNGKDLSGWAALDGDAQWEVLDGAISVTQGSGYLRHETVCQDFDLRLYVRTAPGANGGVFFRWSPTGARDRGQEIQVFDFVGATMCTGSVYGKARADDVGLTPRQWELLQIFVRGSKVVTYVNGMKGAETDAVDVVRPGWIVLQAHRDGATLEYKDLVLTPVK